MAVDLSGVEVGDIVTRRLGGAVNMDQLVVEVNEKTFMTKPVEHPNFPDLWEFDIETGAEIDHELRWGPSYGITGSVITELKKKN